MGALRGYRLLEFFSYVLQDCILPIGSDVGLDFINLTTKCLQTGIAIIINTISVTSTTLLFSYALQIDTLVCKSYVVKFRIN